MAGIRSGEWKNTTKLLYVLERIVLVLAGSTWSRTGGQRGGEKCPGPALPSRAISWTEVHGQLRGSEANVQWAERVSQKADPNQAGERDPEGQQRQHRTAKRHHPKTLQRMGPSVWLSQQASKFRRARLVGHRPDRVSDLHGPFISGQQRPLRLAPPLQQTSLGIKKQARASWWSLPF